MSLVLDPAVCILLLLTVCIVVLFLVGCRIGRDEEKLKNMFRDEQERL